MCGLVGFAGPAVDLRALTRVMLETEAVRGGDAFGWAWVDGDGRLRMFKAAGMFAGRPGLLDMTWDARLFVGHLRLASRGAAHMTCHAHPHPADGGWLCHNGTLPHHDGLAARHGVYPAAECDSEVLAGLLEVAPARTLPGRLAWALEQGRQDRPQAAMGLWSRPGRLLAARAWMPLAWTRAHGGVYLASLRGHLPGRPRELPDNRVMSASAAGMKECCRVPGAQQTLKSRDGWLF
jgi:glucosamine 6-phosphate synthetase-like amidotransferase/phosphosugar isomerase protein